MIVAVPKEIIEGEQRVALIPATIASLKKAGLEVIVQQGAGLGSFISDAAYKDAGASLVKNASELYQQADVLLKIRPLVLSKTTNELALIEKKTVVISLLDAAFNLDLVQQMAAKGITSFGMEFIPRISRAQSMDVLSSMAAISGYSAVIEAAAHLPRYFPMLMTSAGTILPSKVFVIGAGVAGLMAISTAKRLGAVVEAYDTRPVVKEQVESVGAKFVEFDLKTEDAEGKGGYAKAQSDDFYKRQQEQMAAKVSHVDVVITTAAIPGKKSPVLITDSMLQGMTPGSVIVDLAAERGGNVEGTEVGKVVVKHGVTIVGYIDYPSRKSVHASQLYSKNISMFLLNLCKGGQLNLNLEDQIIADSLVTHEGKVIPETLQALLKDSSTS
ncbi:Re/Si-specific NAD(P)(+) transhydrogenase subunit alpha [Deltaproteobacteria bacterium TL4]